jgi:hypothetical protein
VSADKGLGDVFTGAVNYRILVIVRDIFEETDFPVYTFFYQNMRIGEFKRLRMNIGSVFEKQCH